MVDMVNHPPHYTGHPSGIECIWITRFMTFSAGNAFKYVFRSADKGDHQQDLRKALWYLEDALRHADPVFNFLAAAFARPALDRVCAAEPDPNKLAFYTAVRRSDLATARKAVLKMLE